MNTTESHPKCPPLPDDVAARCCRPIWPHGPGQPAADWGYAQGLAAAQRLAVEERQKGADAWPEPITDRPPTEADGDDGGKVQVRFFDRWDCMSVEDAAKAHPVAGWHHTPRWRPPAPTKREQALEALREHLIYPMRAQSQTPRAVMELALQALEEAGDER